MPSTRHALLAVTFGVGMSVLTPACESSHETVHCDYVATRCAMVCDNWCDSYGCYPDCYDRCWDECGVSPPAPAVPPDAGAALDAGDAAAAAPPPVDAGVGDGGLCAACASNDTCTAGSLCIFRGGDAGTSGFCATPCSSATDCGQGFACTVIGSGKHCLPAGPSGCR
jgi:hypothetical protein